MLITYSRLIRGWLNEQSQVVVHDSKLLLNGKVVQQGHIRYGFDFILI